ncbi:MAG: hypothetical protein GYA36_17125, partial [Veillonellaceae bacterium]|nr:hypothetical protein [Veillonellaceae bacterium]
ATAPELGLPAIRSMVAMGLDVVALMGRVSRAGRVERTLQAIALIDGIDAKGDYRLKYLYRAVGDQGTPSIEQAFVNLGECSLRGRDE